MKGKIALLLLAVFPVTAFADAFVHNCTGYNFKAEEWHTIGVCKEIKNKDLPKNTVTKIDVRCNFKKAKLGAYIGDKPVSGVLAADETTVGDRHFYIFAESPITRERVGKVGSLSTESTKYVRFYLWVTPKKGIGHKGGLYAVSDWYDTVTGNKLNDKEAEDAGLEVEKPDLAF